MPCFHCEGSGSVLFFPQCYITSDYLRRYSVVGWKPENAETCDSSCQNARYIHGPPVPYTAANQLSLAWDQPLHLACSSVGSKAEKGLERPIASGAPAR